MAQQQKAVTKPQALIVETDPRSPASEAYRTLRTNIQFSGVDHPCHSILVTSAAPGEGKSTTVANFGAVAAAAGARVCLVDSDLRRPVLHRVFGLENTRGFTTALVEDLSFATVALATRVPNLWVVPSGPTPPNPAEMVASKRMRELLAAAVADFDLLLLDSPPAVSVSDAIALSAQCDGVILVVRAGHVAPEILRRITAQIEAVHGRILGVLLNSVDFRRDSYYSDYYRYYNAYYGKEEKQGSAKR